LRILLSLIILVEIAFGVLYAVETPRWEAPDEPAQFNYIRQVAETGALPILQTGDYNQAYLEAIKQAKFPPAMSIDSLRYESYQPPLYYLLATPVYLAAQAGGFDPVLALRLFSVALGALLLVLAARVLALIFPTNAFLVIAGVGWMATVPMHVAMAAAINADVLAEVLLATLVLISLLRASGRLSDRRFAIAGGITFGLALLTSTKTYPSAVLLILAQAGYIRLRAEEQNPKIQNLKSEGKPRGTWNLPRNPLSGFDFRSWKPLLAALGIALLLSFWWFARNATVYGGTDLLGWARHDLVVTGQPTTAEWIARYGFKNIFADFFIITFKSFWAQFGWMGVLVNDRIYVALFLLTAAALLGALLWVIRMIRERGRELHGTAWSWLMLGAWLLIVLLAHAWYNTRYVQPQGRYLFPALIPLAALFVVGLYELFDKRYTRVLFGLLYVAMLGLDYVSLFWFIIPQLSR
jgi:hypothetical protein